MAHRTPSSARAHLLHGFDARSLLLFAGLTLGGTQALMAQTAAPSTAAPASSSAPPSHTATPEMHAPQAAPMPAPARVTAEPANTDARAAFGRADSNGDGKVTLREAERFPAVAERFSTFDSDRNGSLSPEEFARSIAKP